VGEPKKPRDWDNWIDEQIRDAQQRGAFDDLPGKGRPLDLTPNPYARDRELAFKILKDAGYAPEWIELDKVIRGKLERARANLDRSWEWRRERLGELAGQTDSWGLAERERVVDGWHRAVAAFEEEVEAINKEIGELNLKVPSHRFQRKKVDAARDVARLEAEGPADPLAVPTPRERMAETVRQVVSRRERAPRSPRMERALKRLIWRYTGIGRAGAGERDRDAHQD
jgi:DnaJ homolog subfamily C member 28